MFGRATLNFASAARGDGPRPVEVTVRDGRAAEPAGVGGLRLRTRRTLVGGQRVGATSRSWPCTTREMEQLATSMTGCDHALVSSHIKRGPDQAARHEDLAPISFVHSDFAPGYDDMIKRMYRDGGGDGCTHRARAQRADGGRRRTGAADGDPAVLAQHRPGEDGLSDRVLRRPLDLVRRRALRSSCTTTPGVASTSRRWRSWRRPSPPSALVHVPELRPDEVIAFRTYDSDLVRDGTTYFTPHSAFRDAEVEIGRPARQSIELRANCLYF